MKHKTVVIDPPWPIKFGKPAERFRRKSGKWKNLKGHSLDYDVQTIDDIRAFPIDNFADEECILFLWVTTGKIDGIPIIKTGLEMLEQWGFTYHQIITWCKNTGFAVWSPFNSRTEHILVGYRGALPKVYGAMPNYFETAQLKHSEKPAKFYQILRAWTPEPRIDIFARNAHEGFDGWGNEYVGDGPLQKYLGPLQEMLEG